MKAVLFDLDGTLVSAKKEYRENSVKKVLQILGKPFPGEKQVEKFWFQHNRDSVIASWGTPPTKFWEEFNKQDNVEARKKQSFVFSDVKKTLKFLRSKGLLIGIVTNGTPSVAELGIELVGKELIDVLVVAHEYKKKKPKPAPDSLHECCELLGVKENQCIFVGNGLEDILSSKKAGMKAVLIKRGEHLPSKKAEQKADLVIDSLDELIEFLGV